MQLTLTLPCLVILPCHLTHASLALSASIRCVPTTTRSTISTLSLLPAPTAQRSHLGLTSPL